MNDNPNKWALMNRCTHNYVNLQLPRCTSVVFSSPSKISSCVHLRSSDVQLGTCGHPYRIYIVGVVKPIDTNFYMLILEPCLDLRERTSSIQKIKYTINW